MLCLLVFFIRSDVAPVLPNWGVVNQVDIAQEDIFTGHQIFCIVCVQVNVHNELQLYKLVV